MKNCLALVLAGGRVDELNLLTLSRPKSAVPFGGMYRVIDFCLSNLMNSGIEKIGVVSQYRSLALVNHIGVGSWWDFVGRDRGATMLLPSTKHLGGDWYSGTANAIYQNIEFIKEKNPELVLILSGDHIYKMDYASMATFHYDMDADLTVAFGAIDPAQSNRFGVADIGDEMHGYGGVLKSYLEKPEREQQPWASLTIYMFKPEALYRALEENSGENSHEFGRDIIPAMLKKHKVCGYKFHDYWGYTRTIEEYWQTSMDLLKPDSPIDLEKWNIRTNLDHDKLRDRAPARIRSTAELNNSFVYNGCDIAGKIENSILFPGVKVGEGAYIKDSIIFYDSVICENACITKTVADFDVVVEKNSVIGSNNSKTTKQDSSSQLTSGISVIGKGTVVPQNTIIGSNCSISPSLKTTDFKQKKYKSGTVIE